MNPRARDALLASIAAALGVSPFACASEPAPQAQQPAVAAREVTPWAGAAPAEATAIATDASIEAAAITASAAPDDAAASTVPDAASILTVADAAGIPRIATPDAIPLSMFIIADPAAPPPAPRPAPASAPTACHGLACISGNTSTGAQADCGAVARVSEPRVSAVHVGLQPRPGAQAADVDRVARALASVRQKARSCAQRAINTTPITESTTIVVVARSPGNRAEAAFTASPKIDPSFEPCIDRSMRWILGGDEKPAQLVFRMVLEIRD